MDLAILWFFIWGTLWAVYFVMDGFDLGVGILYHFLGKTAAERNSMLASIGPFWDGNEVWLVTAGTVTFAAFPAVYAAMFSAFYGVFSLLLVALILRGVAVKFHSRLKEKWWRNGWGAAFFAGSLATPLLIGVAFGNLFRGLPLGPEGFRGSFTDLLHPYALLTGVTFTALFTLHGALWLTVKSPGDLRQRAARTVTGIWIGLSLLVLMFLVSSALATPLAENYLRYPVLMIVPTVTSGSLVIIGFCIIERRFGFAFAASAFFIAALAAAAIIGLYPNMVASLPDPRYTLTVFNAAASPYSLKIMTVVAAVFLPLTVVYQVWVYGIFRGGVTEGDLDEEEY